MQAVTADDAVKDSCRAPEKDLLRDAARFEVETISSTRIQRGDCCGSL